MMKIGKVVRRVLFSLTVLCFLAASGFAATLPASERVVVNLGAQPWTFFEGDPAGAQEPGFPDSSWKQVGVPYSPDDLYSFLNAPAGGGDGSTSPAGTVWYRTPIVLGPQYANRKVLVEIEGAHVGVQAYINGTLLPGISAVTADAQATHVVGFIPVIVDLTPYLKFDGSNNILAIRVSKSGSFYEDPNFAEGFRFGQGFLGLFRPVKMFITDPVHIPENVYSNLKTWGTHVSTLTASNNSAQIDVQTNVVNEGTTTKQVTVTTQIVDAGGNVVQSGSLTEAVAPSALPNLAPQLFDQQLTVTNPTLWYPNGSIWGGPYMYQVFHTVSINGAVVDAVQSPLGIRTITWDTNFPYFNGKQQYLWGGSGRYDYPAMASAVPEEQQWRDLQQLAAAGGNLWRPGHSSPSEEFLDAADAYGVMVVDPSGEGEGEFGTPCEPSCDKGTLKTELHRDMIIRDRNHPSILSWEADNGAILTSFAQTLQGIVNQWDPTPIPRVQADRSFATSPPGQEAPDNGYVLGCTLSGCENLVKQDFPNNPAWGAEYWNNGTARFAWDDELAFAAPFLDDWRQGRTNNTFGMVQWYFADTPGEDNNYVEGTLPANTRTFGTSMVDFNRFPKMLYYIYEAAWTPYQNAAGQTHPVVHLAHHWNRAYQSSAPIQVNAFSNCPKVRLLLNGVAQGSDQVPNPWTSVDPNANSYPDGETGGSELQASAAVQQQTTTMPFQVHWNVTWAPGTITAECLDDLGNLATYNGVPATDSKTTAGAPDHIVLTVVPELTKPNGTSFAITANGSDAAFIQASVVDANGVIVPTDNTDTLTFAVSGPATYKGGSEAYVSTGTDAYVTSAANPYGSGYGTPAWAYHAPGDPQLQVEGGRTKVVVRSQFTAGPVTVTASAPGLGSGTTTFTIAPAVMTTSPVAAAPEIIGQPANTAVTAGQTATFSVIASGAAPLTFQWSKNGGAIAGATSATYTTPPTTAMDNNAQFTVSVANSVGAPQTSNPAVLSVDTPAGIVITAQPQAAPAFAGQQLTLSVMATGSPTLTYQWKRNGTNIAGAIGSTYTTAPLAVAGDNGSTYQVTVTNPVGSVASTVVTLTVSPAVAPAITGEPQNVSVPVNEQAVFTVTATGTAPLTYQWQKNGASIQGANASVFTIASVQSTDAGSYTVAVSNAASTVTSGPAAVLTVLPPGPNLALNQMTFASSQNGQQNTPASAAFDGNLSTRWDSLEGAGADPSWLAVNFGSKQTFNTVVLYWDPAFASSFQMQWSNDGTNWTPTTTATLTGNAGAQTITFPGVTAQYLRMNGTARATPYGYSIDEMQVYEVASCTQPGDTNERFTVQSNNTEVKDNQTGLVWQRTPYTLTAAGSQLTQPLAAAYCSNMGMRLPTQAEALAIAGPNLATCAFPQPWTTWTSTSVPNSSTEAWIVGSNATSQSAVAGNYPGAVLCTSGTVAGAPTAPVITTQPAAQTVALGQTATFTVAATGTGTLAYQWSKNSNPIAGATSASYTTPATVATDNAATFSVVVSSSNGTSVASAAAVLTVTGGSGGGSPTGTDLVAIASGSPVPIGSFSADTDFVGGGHDSNCTTTINTAGVVGAGPAALYQPEHVGVFTYTIPGLVTGTNYGVRLHFAECYFSTAGKRIFNVLINGTTVLPNFDIVQAGGADTAVVRTFTEPAIAGPNGTGEMVISFTAVANADQPKIDGVEILNLGASAPPPSAPTITTQPASATVAVGASATFRVVAGGAGPFTYQWSKNNAAIAGATAATYTTPATVAADNGSSFTVVVSAGGGSVTSNAALLTVKAAVSGGVPTISAQPAAATATIGRTAQFSVTAAGAAPLTYQWSRNGKTIPGATGATYITPGTTAADNDATFTVVASNSSGASAPSTPAALTVSTADPSTALTPGFLVTDLNNNTNGAWTNNQIYVEVIGSDPTNNGALVWVNYDGTRHAASVADNTAAGHLTGPDGNSYPDYHFTLAQSGTLKLPPGSGRIYISMGSPMYMPVTAAGSNGINGYAGPNPQNPTDPNINTHYDWYEYTSGLNADGTNNIYINTTQVDYFGLPLLLDLWDGKNGITLGGVTSGHGQTGINESIAAIDTEYAAQTPAAFHLTPVSSLRIPSPDKSTFVPGQPNATYFDSYISSVWSYYTTNSLSVTLGSRVFTGTVQGDNFVFTEPNPVPGAAGAAYPIGEPTTENVVACDGVFGTDTFSGLPSSDPRRGVESGIETALCATFNRHIVENPSEWANPADYYLAAPANYYAQFWHNHSVGALAYGFPYDDFDGYSSTVVSFDAQHMAFGIGW